MSLGKPPAAEAGEQSGSDLDATAPAPSTQANAASSIALATMSDVLFHLKVVGEDDYAFLQVNPAFYNATMLQPEQVIGKRLHEVIPPASLPLVMDHYRRAISTRTTQRWEEVSVYPAGRKVGQVTVTPVFDDSGRCTDLVGTVHDVSRLVEREDQLRLAHARLEVSLAEQRDMADALQASEERLNLALSATQEGVWDWLVEQDKVFFSEQWKKTVGLPADWPTPSRAAWSERIHPEDRARVLASVTESLRVAGEGYDCEYRLRHASGGWIWLRSRGRVVERDAGGAARRMTGTMSDITETVNLRQQVERSQARLVRLSQHLPGAVFEVRMAADGRFACVFASEQVQELFGMAPQQIEASWSMLAQHVLDADRPRIHRALRRSAAALAPVRFEFRVTLSGQGQSWREVTASPARTPQGEVVWYGFVHDISERKHTEHTIRTFNAAMEHRAHHDSLTGLPNRVLFRDRLVQGMRHAQAAASALALLFIDLDRFKGINDLLGHSAGDELLAEVARRIEGCVRPGDTVARLGGDEFTVILAEAREHELVEQAAQRILDILAAPIQLKSEQVHVAGSIGIALYPQDAVDSEELMRNADHAMYRSKASGRNRMTFFEPAMRSSAIQRLTLIAELRRALPDDQLVLYYQPIVSLESGMTVKAEALLRWHRPGKGLTSPGEFIAAAEDSGLIHELGDWVFCEAAGMAARWSAQLGHAFQVSINRSPVQFQPNVRGLDWVAYLRSAGISPECISVEITEGVLLNLSGGVEAQLDRFSEAGIEVAIDDFGTGYSSMSYLKRLDIDYLKIDRSFVAGLGTDPTSTAITETIIVMARKLGLKVIAEGVETALQRDWLLAHGCDYAQGYLFSRPVPAVEFEQRLEREMRAAGL